MVLPLTESPEPDDFARAVRAVAFTEDRTPDELLTDLSVAGGADTLSVRLTPYGVPSGRAPLVLAQETMAALHEFVVGSASSLETSAQVLPSRRPQRAANYAEQTLVSTAPGSFIVNLALPRLETPTAALPENIQPVLMDVPSQQYGLRVARRMRSIAQVAVGMASQITQNDSPISLFGNLASLAPNSTELDALATLGGTAFNGYQMRFTEAPIGRAKVEPLLLPVTSREQRTLADAAAYLRESQPRTDITVVGRVVRLHRDGAFGSGEVTVQGESNRPELKRRFTLEVGEQDYNEALRAHSRGLLVMVVGDVEQAGTRTSLRRITYFDVLPGIDDQVDPHA